MNRIISGITLLLMTFSALAQDAPMVAAPQVDADPTGMIVFAVLLVGMIGGYVWYIYVKERKKNLAAK